MSRLRTVLLALSAATAVASIVLLVSPAGAAPAGAPGNNGTVKIHDGATEPPPEVRNEPHVCTFHVHAFFFDAGQTLKFTVQSWEPTGDGTVVLSGSITTDADGEGRTPASGAYSLPDGHYRLTVDTGNGTPTQDKHKMFWVTCKPTPTSPPPTTTAPPSPTSPPPTTTAPPTGSVSPTVPGGTLSAPPTSPAAGPGEQPTTPGGLAETGSSVLGITGLGLSLLLAGIALALAPAARRRLSGRH